MKRGVFDILRRAFDNTIANWQLLLIRAGAILLLLILSFGVILALLVPLLVSFGIELASFRTPEDIVPVLESVLQRWVVVVWLFAGASVLLLLYVALQAFVEAGCARVYVDADRMAGPALSGPRERFRAFSMERWYAGALDGWWTLFWIYNLGWGAASIVLLIPLLPTIVLMLVFQESNQGLALAAGCVGLLATFGLAIVVMMVAAIWTTRAIAVWGVHGSGAREALAAGWRALKEDLGRHVLIVLASVVVMFAGSAFFASISFFAAFGDIIGQGHASVTIFTIPLRMLGSFLDGAFSAVVFSWMLAAYVAIAVEGEGVKSLFRESRPSP